MPSGHAIPLAQERSIAPGTRHVGVGANPGDPCAHCEARHYSVCNAIEPADLERLASIAVQQQFETGRSFIEEGDPAAHFFNVTSGTAKLFKLLPDGRRQITGFASTGHFLGLAVSSSYSFGAEALEPMRLCRFSRTKLRTLLDDFPAMETRLLDVASNELVAAQEQMLLLGRKTARERLASFLIARIGLGIPGAPPCAHQGATRVVLPMSRSDIADYLGLTIETVSRTLTRLRLDGLVALDSPSEVVVVDYLALERVATGMV
jgi:CRP/FNR family transcriptional regulator, anaerobic regulatory protein